VGGGVPGGWPLTTFFFSTWFLGGSTRGGVVFPRGFCFGRIFFCGSGGWGVAPKPLTPKNKKKTKLSKTAQFQNQIKGDPLCFLFFFLFGGVGVGKKKGGPTGRKKNNNKKKNPFLGWGGGGVGAGWGGWGLGFSSKKIIKKKKPPGPLITIVAGGFVFLFPGFMGALGGGGGGAPLAVFCLGLFF